MGCFDLAVSGSMLLCVGYCKGDRSGFMVVLDADTDNYQHTLRLDPFISSLLSMRGKMWGRLGNGNVVVWGKVERGEGSGMSEEGRA